jgi:hypothetical protein
MSKMIANLVQHQGKGAQFLAYVSPPSDTSTAVTKWAVKIEATDNN